VRHQRRDEIVRQTPELLRRVTAGDDSASQ
jgi:hypothetical protein